MALKLRATRPPAHLSLNDSSCAPAHNTPRPLARSPPGSFKRLLGASIYGLIRNTNHCHTRVLTGCPCASPGTKAARATAFRAALAKSSPSLRSTRKVSARTAPLLSMTNSANTRPSCLVHLALGGYSGLGSLRSWGRRSSWQLRYSMWPPAARGRESNPLSCAVPSRAVRRRSRSVADAATDHFSTESRLTESTTARKNGAFCDPFPSIPTESQPCPKFATSGTVIKAVRSCRRTRETESTRAATLFTHRRVWIGARVMVVARTPSRPCRLRRLGEASNCTPWIESPKVTKSTRGQATLSGAGVSVWAGDGTAPPRTTRIHAAHARRVQAHAMSRWEDDP